MTGHELDQLIERALPGYVAEPEPGLKARVLQRVAPRRPLRWRLPVGLAAAAAVLLVVLLVVSLPQRSAAPAPTAPSPVAAVAPAPPPPPRPAQRSVNPTLGKAVKTGTPLSRPERQLVEFVQSHPALAAQVLMEEPLRLKEPLKIEELASATLEIKPLETAPL